MQESNSPELQTPFDAMESVWAMDTADDWEHRGFMFQTLTGFLHSVYGAVMESRITHGIAFVPRDFAEDTGWWPADRSDQIIGWDGEEKNWAVIPSPMDDPSLLHGEFWMLWLGEHGCGIMMARRDQPTAGKSPLGLDIWHLRICWSPLAMMDAIPAFRDCFNADHPVVARLNKLERDLPIEFGPEADVLGATLQAALKMAGHMDPRGRSETSEKQWTEIFNSIQLDVAWHLYSDRLLPAIGRALHKGLGYDFIDIHVFNRLGSRFEEFLSWQENLTGYGKDLNIFVDKVAVKKLLEKGRPRLITMSKSHGVLNPHLAELAGLKDGLLVPLVNENKVQGMIAMYYSRPSGLESSDLERVGKIGEIIARSIENSNAHEDMRLMASVDALTGLSNRRSFNEVIEKESHRSLRYKLPLSLVLIDIDFFKAYNDTNGHLKGDYLLRDFAGILRRMVREEDTVARYGGEEFAIVLPHTTADNAYAAAEKIRRRVAETNFQEMDSQPSGRITISLGVADTDGTSIDEYQELIDMADKALYRAKETGRNRTVMYSPELASQSA
jgi:diguanylate cyclase (GGDEF)-like protein